MNAGGRLSLTYYEILRIKFARRCPGGDVACGVAGTITKSTDPLVPASEACVRRPDSVARL